MGRLLSLFTAVMISIALAGPAAAVASPPSSAPGQIQCGFPTTLTDATGSAVTITTEPHRIVTLSPSAAQTMWEIGGKEKVVGVSQYAAYLDDAGTRANISGGSQSFVNIERVVRLDPDLVLAPNIIPNSTVTKLRQAGLTVFKFPFQSSIEDIEQKTLLTGRLTGECPGAIRTVEWMEAELRIVREAVKGQDRPRVLYVFWTYTGGTGTFVHTVIQTAGGTNIAAEANISGYQPISREIVVEYNPEWIVVNDGATQIPNEAAYNSTDAIEHDRIVILEEEHISQPAPRIVLAVRKLAKALHPDAYARAASRTRNATGIPTAIEPTSRNPIRATPSPGATPTSASSPGFGIGISIISVSLLVAFVLRHRA